MVWRLTGLSQQMEQIPYIYYNYKIKKYSWLNIYLDFGFNIIDCQRQKGRGNVLLMNENNDGIVVTN